MESVQNQNIEEIIKNLQSKSVNFKHITSDTDTLYAKVNELLGNQEKIKEIMNLYETSKGQPVNFLRLIVAKKLQEGTKINPELISIIQEKFRSKDLKFFMPYLNKEQIDYIKNYSDNTSPYNVWSDSACLSPFIYEKEYKKAVIDELKIIADHIKSELFLKNYETSCQGFEGPNNFGKPELNIRIFPNNLLNFKTSVFYFIVIKEGKLFAGIDNGNKVSNIINIPKELKEREYPNINVIINFFKENNMFEKEQNEKIYNIIKSRNYWAAGCYWGVEGYKLEEFNKNMCWEIGGEKNDSKRKESWENISRVKVGDYIAFKSYGGRNDLKILQISEVTGKSEDGEKIYFKKITDKNLYKGKGPKKQNWFDTLFQIKDLSVIETIFGDLIFMEKENTNLLVTQYKELLENTHNIILHGAPGTGKTHLAKDIAKAMGAETEFVQFHPSYDYTDFVEGLRPVKNDNDIQIGFERKDGIFKELCKAALENLENSNKSKEEIKKETIITENIDNFLNNAIENETEFETEQNTFVIDDLTDTHIIIIATNKKDKTKEYKRILQKVNLQTLLEQDKSVTAIKEIKDIVDRKSARAEDSYLLALYKGIKNILQTKQDIKDASIPENKRKNYVLIIDEINRGDFSKIFGELFFSIDPGYRGKDGIVKTQYQNLIKKENKDKFVDGFYVPENVYIIGTMNDIDRNVESMDFAFRRRFTFVEIKAKDTAGEILAGLKNPELIADCKNIMTKLNAKISEIKELGSPDDYHIGAAYFLKLPDLNNNYKKLWDYHLSGLLKEYFRGLEKDYLTEIENEYNKLIGYVETSNEGQ